MKAEQQATTRRVTGQEATTELGCLFIAAMIVQIVTIGPFPRSGLDLVAPILYGLTILLVFYAPIFLGVLVIDKIRKRRIEPSSAHRTALLIAALLLALLAFGGWYGQTHAGR